jgi:mannose-6-phosphate isomerase, type 1 (EC 5.3.1.8)
MRLFKLNNTIQNYAWGGKTSLTDLFDIDNQTNIPQAEIWMGAHVNGCSTLVPTEQKLSDYIAAQKTQALGKVRISPAI